MEYIARRLPAYKFRQAKVLGGPTHFLSGKGYLGGDYPDGVVKLEGAPVVAEVCVFWRGYGPYDGLLVAKTMSNPDGTWRISGLNPTLKYDIAVRKDGFNDIVWSDMTPEVEE